MNENFKTTTTTIIIIMIMIIIKKTKIMEWKMKRIWHYN